MSGTKLARALCAAGACAAHLCLTFRMPNLMQLVELATNEMIDCSEFDIQSSAFDICIQILNKQHHSIAKAIYPPLKLFACSPFTRLRTEAVLRRAQPLYLIPLYLPDGQGISNVECRMTNVEGMRLRSSTFRVRRSTFAFKY